MIDILLCSLIVSLFCNGLKISTGEGMLLNFIKVKLDKIFVTEGFQFYSHQKGYYDTEFRVKKIYYPILYCIKCMPSIYGTVIGLWFLPFSINLLWQLPLVIFCSVTLNNIFYQFYE